MRYVCELPRIRQLKTLTNPFAAISLQNHVCAPLKLPKPFASDTSLYTRRQSTMIRRQLLRRFSISSTSLSDFSHVVIGGGIVGTAIGAELQLKEGSSVLLVEQHEKLGMETTARNSEVIHAGLYYPKDSLKAKLCIQGKNKIYAAYHLGMFNSVQVPLQQCGKLVVAQTEQEMEYIEKLKVHADELGVPVSLVSKEKAMEQQPNIRVGAGALESPTTGIVSAHDLNLYFETQLENAGGTIALNTKLQGIEYSSSMKKYTLYLEDSANDTTFEITADNVVNSAGLHAPRVSNMLLPADRALTSYFAKGSYFGYSPQDTPIKVASKLIYPCPNPNASSLGVHLTFDLGGQVRFGPDLEWVDTDNAYDLNYDVSLNNLDAAYQEIKRYFPHVTRNALQPSYSGVRPKLLSAQENKRTFADFDIREEPGFPGFVNLLGIESPGLTSSWAIADYVADIYYK